MALPWIFDRFLRKSGGTMTGALTLSDGSAAEGVAAYGAGYIRWKSGQQICFGTFVSANAYIETKSFAIAFAYVPTVILTAVHNSSDSLYYCRLAYNSTTSFLYVKHHIAHGVGEYQATKDQFSVGYVAVGNWK